MKNAKIKDMTQCAIFAAIIVVMTVVPFTGYINLGVFIPILALVEITTLHMVVILGAVRLGWKYGAVLGGVWGITCMARAMTNSLWLDFTNPLISLVPRVCVGAVAGIVFYLLCKGAENRRVSPLHSLVVGLCAGVFAFALANLQEWQLWLKIVIAIIVLTIVTCLFLWLNRKYGTWKAYAASIAALCGSLTNTVLVLSAYSAFGSVMKGTTIQDTFAGILSTLITVNGSVELLAAVLIVPVLTVTLERAAKA